jgi:hypothetical protein
MRSSRPHLALLLHTDTIPSTRLHLALRLLRIRKQATFLLSKVSSLHIISQRNADERVVTSGARRRKFVSARLQEGEYDEKPWLTGKEDPNFKRRRWEKIIFWTSIALGVVIGCAICALSYMSVSTGTFCQVWEDDFSHIDPASWSYEIQRGGFGTGAFDWTTDDPKNSYTDAEGLHIVPTLTTETTNITPEQIYDGYRLNLTTDKTCTSPDYTMCSIYSNKTTGDIINPVRSARMTTKGKRSIQYGKVEVVAKMPKGDWLWPAIWMMPEDDVYGSWPMSGEIDIAESRGNSPENYTDGRNSIISALHWGPSPETDAFWRTSGKHNLRRTDYSENFHTYGLEWTKDYLFMYIDNQLLVSFKQRLPLPKHLTNSQRSKCSSSSSPLGRETCGTAATLANTNPTSPPCSMLGLKRECAIRLSTRNSTSSSTLLSAVRTASSRTASATNLGVTAVLLVRKNSGTLERSGALPGASRMSGE